MLVRLQDAHAPFVRRGKRHEADRLRRHVQRLRQTPHQILPAEYAYDFPRREQAPYFIRQGQRRQPAHDIPPHEILQKGRRAQRRRRVETRLPCAVRTASYDIPAGGLHPWQKPPRTILYGERPPARPRQTHTPIAEGGPCPRRILRIQPRRRHEVLSVDEPVIRDSRRRQGEHAPVLHPHLVPQGERRGRPVRGSRLHPLVQRMDKTLFRVMPQDMEPRLVDVGGRTARKREHERRPPPRPR